MVYIILLMVVLSVFIPFSGYITRIITEIEDGNLYKILMNQRFESCYLPVSSNYIVTIYYICVAFILFLFIKVLQHYVIKPTIIYNIVIKPTIYYNIVIKSTL